MCRTYGGGARTPWRVWARGRGGSVLGIHERSKGPALKRIIPMRAFQSAKALLTRVNAGAPPKGRSEEGGTTSTSKALRTPRLSPDGPEGKDSAIDHRASLYWVVERARDECRTPTDYRECQ